MQVLVAPQCDSNWLTFSLLMKNKSRMACADPEGGQGVRTASLHNHYRFLSYAGPDPLQNYKATNPAFDVGPSSTLQRNAM